MSDGILRRFLSGKFGFPQRSLDAPQPKRRLVEESEVIVIGAVQRVFGKKALIAAIRECRPFRLPVPGGFFDVWLVSEEHRLPGKHEQWASLENGTSRLWFVCWGCRRKVSKLYYFWFTPGCISELRCRECHGLTYLCTNAGGNRWYKEIARPLKRLLRERRRLLSQKRGRLSTKLAQIDDEVGALRDKIENSHRTRKSPTYRTRRRYRDFTLIDDAPAM